MKFKLKYLLLILGIILISLYYYYYVNQSININDSFNNNNANTTMKLNKSIINPTNKETINDNNNKEYDNIISANKNHHEYMKKYKFLNKNDIISIQNDM